LKSNEKATILKSLQRLGEIVDLNACLIDVILQAAHLTHLVTVLEHPE
jgi:hypothetical protein